MNIKRTWLKSFTLALVMFSLIAVSAQSDTRHTGEQQTFTIFLQRATAIRILNTGLDRDSRDEIVGALRGERRDGKLEVVIITADDADEWAERLRDGLPVDQVLAKRLEGAFALALGTFIEPDKRWTFRE